MTISFLFKYKRADYLKARPTCKCFNLSLIYIQKFPLEIYVYNDFAGRR